MGLDTVELVIEVEKCCGIHIDNEVASQIETVGQLCEVARKYVLLRGDDHCITSEDVQCRYCRYCLKTLPVEGKCPECGRRYSMNRVEEMVVDILVDFFGVDRKKIVMDSRIVKDLGLD